MDSEVTRILHAIEAGNGAASEELLPLVYGDLRRLANARLNRETPDQSLLATELVHEAYLRLVGTEDLAWESRGHFFGAAAESMRRILIDRARAKGTGKRGASWKRIALDPAALSFDEVPPELLDLDEALRRFEVLDKTKAELVKLRFFTGLSMAQAAEILGISTATATRHWAYARAWLHNELSEGETSGQESPEA